MLAQIVRTALQFRVLVVALAVALLAVGGEVARRAPLDVFPEFAPPIVEIQTEAPGMAAEEVESLVTVPLETALSGLSWLTTIRSKSVLGLSSVVLIFEEDTDLLRARQIVQERLDTERSRLPLAAEPPVMLPPLSSLSRVMKIGLSSTTLSPTDLTDLTLRTIRPRLMAVPGVANVAIWGQRDREFQVRVDPARLAAHGVTLDRVIRAAGDATIADASGFVDTPNQRLSVRVLPSVTIASELAGTIVAQLPGATGPPLRLGDVASVVEGNPVPIGSAWIDDAPGLLLVVEKQPWGNTLEVTRGIDDALAQLAPALHGVKVDATIFRPATFIERSLKNLANATALGCALVALVLVLFLFEWRTALVSILAIPLSLLAAAVVLRLQGATLNVMTIAGLVIAIGEVVDDAIIDVENIARRWRLNAKAAAPRSAFRVVLDASLEVRSAVVFASLIVILVFLPVFFLDGLAGSFFRPLAHAYVLAIAASLLVALTVTPALSLLLLRPGAIERERKDPVIVRALKAAYRRVLPPFVDRPALVGGGVIAALALSIALASRLGEELLPSFRETDFLMHWVSKPGASLESMERVTALASKELRSVPGVRNFGAHIGRAEVADEVVGPNFTELWISIDEAAPYEATVARVQEIVDGYPGLYRDLLTYLRERIKEVLTGSAAAIVVRVFGDDLERIRSKADEIAARVAKIEGVSALKVEPITRVPQVMVRLRPEACAAHGVTAADVRRTVSALLRGVKAAQIYDARRSIDVVVRGEPHLREDPLALRRVWIDAGSGRSVALDEVADVYVAETANEVKRESASRRIDVTCNVESRDLGSVARDVRAAVAATEFALGDHAEILGEHAARQAARERLFWLSLVAVLGILLLLQADFGDWRPALLVFLTLPFALIGGVLGAWAGGGVLSLGSLVGFVTVLGIAARNGILLVSHWRRLEAEGAGSPREILLRGAEERLTPILMTAACAGLGLLPLALGGDRPGHEIEYPLAVVILGGLATSTLLNLLVLPALYLRFGPKGSESAVPNALR